jgi:hypothetical protein
MIINGKVFYTALTSTIFSLVFVFGCASKGVSPIENITNAETAIEVAKESNATIHAPLELRLAEEKLSAAQTAFEDGEFDKARFLADEALMDAQFAEAKSLSEKAKKRVEEVRGNVETLRKELERTQRVKQ